MKRGSWIVVIILVMMFFPIAVMAEQPQPIQQTQPKNYEALIAEDGRQRCEGNLAIVLRQVDELKAKIAELQKPKDAEAGKSSETSQDKPGSKAMEKK